MGGCRGDKDKRDDDEARRHRSRSRRDRSRTVLTENRASASSSKQRLFAELARRTTAEQTSSRASAAAASGSSDHVLRIYWIAIMEAQSAAAKLSREHAVSVAGADRIKDLRPPPSMRL